MVLIPEPDPNLEMESGVSCTPESDSSDSSGWMVVVVVVVVSASTTVT